MLSNGNIIAVNMVVM